MLSSNTKSIHIEWQTQRKKTTHLERPVVREHRATDQIQLTTDTTLFTVKTKPYLVMEQQSNEYILCAA